MMRVLLFLNLDLEQKKQPVCCHGWMEMMISKHFAIRKDLGITDHPIETTNIHILYNYI